MAYVLKKDHYFVSSCVYGNGFPVAVETVYHNNIMLLYVTVVHTLQFVWEQILQAIAENMH